MKSTVLHVHPENPQKRLIEQAGECILNGGLVVCPTESCYVLLHGITEKKPHERVLQIRDLPRDHLFTLICADLSQVDRYSRIGTMEYRMLKSHLPGPYTFILGATRLIPKRLVGPKRDTIGVRISSHPVCQQLLQYVGEALVSTTVRLPGWEWPLSDESDLVELLKTRVDCMLLAGTGRTLETTVVDLLADPPKVLRVGLGDTGPLGL